MNMTFTKHPKNFSSRMRRGSTIVEFAFVVPILLLITMAMIQFGIILNAKVSLTHVARQISRYAAVHGTEASVDNSIKTYAVSTAAGFGLRITTSNVTIGPPVENTSTVKTNRTQYVTNLPVTISCDLTSRYFLPTNFFGVPIVRRTVTSTTNVMLE